MEDFAEESNSLFIVNLVDIVNLFGINNFECLYKMYKRHNT